MQRITLAAVTAVAVLALAATGCASEQDDTEDYPCPGQNIVYVDDDEYRCESATGTVIPVFMLDVDIKNKAKSSPGKPVPYTPPKTTFTKPPAPKSNTGVSTNKQPAPAKPPAPAPKAPAPAKPATGKR